MTPAFVNCDWGTTHFRLRLIERGTMAALAQFRSDSGVAMLAAAGPAEDRARRFRETLEHGLRHLAAGFAGALAGAPIVVSGMATSSVGWVELPYASLPLRLDGSDLKWSEVEPIGVNETAQRVFLISGAASETDVMRGEEVQALGVFQLPLASAARDNSWLIMPGTHSKHLRIEQERIVGFRTYLTGELFEVLSRHSLLRHSVQASETSAHAMPDDRGAAFEAGVAWGRDQSLSHALFRVRTRQVLDGTSAGENLAFLSGILIGGELADLMRHSDSEDPLLLLAAEPLDRYYQAACEALGLTARVTLVPPQDAQLVSAWGQEAFLKRMVDS